MQNVIYGMLLLNVNLPQPAAEFRFRELRFWGSSSVPTDESIDIYSVHICTDTYADMAVILTSRTKEK